MANSRTTSARERLLAAAARLFYARGIHATGIDAITAEAGVAKMSLYNNFASKDDLVSAYLTARHEEWLGLYRARLHSAGTPRDRVLAVFDAYLDHASTTEVFRGCGLLNAAAESPTDGDARAAVRRHKEQVESLLVEHLRASGDADPDSTAEHLALVLEGAMERAGLEGGRRRLEAARRIAVAVLDRR